MKYIKTKDKIFEVIKECERSIVVKFPNTLGKRIPKERIKNQSDDLRKLFLDIVVVYAGVPYVALCHPLHKPSDIPNYIEKEYRFNKNDCLIYGSIATKLGLVYAAKLNEKGEWELIYEEETWQRNHNQRKGETDMNDKQANDAINISISIVDIEFHDVALDLLVSATKQVSGENFSYHRAVSFRNYVKKQLEENQ